MRATVALVMAASLGLAVFLTGEAAPYELYGDEAFVRGYFGYVLAIAPSFVAGIAASFLLLTWGE